MPSNTFGSLFSITIFGESHGKCIGVIVDGCPSGLKISESDFQKDLNRRIPRLENVSSPRKEKDKIEILSGIYRGHTTGAPICALVRNKDVEDEPYLERELKPRPSHADFTAWKRYGIFNDFRGGGRFSGRITVAFIIAGTIAKKLLAKLSIEVLAYTKELGGIIVDRQNYSQVKSKTYESPVRCPDSITSKKMLDRILKISKEGDSLGGIIEGIVLNPPLGVGEPIFDSLDADLAKLLFNIPAVKGVEFGLGFEASRLRGSENNDPIVIKNGVVTMATNNAGGIIGGLTTGMPIIVKVAFKPPSSIKKRQKTVDLRTMKEIEIEVKGRHDPCIVPKAVPVIEAVLAIVMVEHLMRANRISKILR